MSERMKSAMWIMVVLLGALALNSLSRFMPRPDYAPRSPSVEAALMIGGLALFFSVTAGISVLLGKYPVTVYNAADPAGGRKAAIASTLALASAGGLLFWMALADPCTCTTRHVAPIVSAAVALFYLVVCLYTARHMSARALRRNQKCATYVLILLIPLVILWSGLAQAGLDVDFEPLGVFALVVGSTFAGSIWLGIAEQARKKRAQKMKSPEPDAT